jgi:hypothetical protein
MERLKLNLSSVGVFMQEVDDYVSCMDFLFEVFFIDVGCGWYVRGRELEGTVEGRIGVHAARMMRRSFVTTSSRYFENIFDVNF